MEVFDPKESVSKKRKEREGEGWERVDRGEERGKRNGEGEGGEHKYSTCIKNCCQKTN